MVLPPPPSERTPAELIEFGVVVLDKPAGPTSHQVGQWVAEIAGVERAGHMGTLDPKVTGCLPVLLGRGTRLTDVLSGGEKGYVALLELHDEPPTDWRDRLLQFEAEIYQKPPRKSAVSRRLRTRTVTELDVLERNGRHVLLNVRCAAGTYIRKLCHDIGLVLGTGGHMASLRRTRSDPFTDAELVTLHDLTDGVAFWQEANDIDALRDVIRPAEDALSHLPNVTISPGTAESVAEGAPVYVPGVIDVDPPIADATDDAPRVVCTIPSGSAICIGRLIGDPHEGDGVVVELDRVLV